MPYKTLFGNHYHMKLGCSGAFVPCGTANLVPCSICCTDRIQKVMSGEIGISETAGGTPSRSVASSEAFSQDGSAQEEPTGVIPNPNVPVVTQETNHESNLGHARSQQTDVQARIQGMNRRIPNDALLADDSGDVRFDVVREIDGYVDSVSDTRSRERVRRQLQAEWNRIHPETPVLEWSRDDSDYMEDSDRAVTLLGGKGDALFGGCSYSIWDKATGQDVTGLIHHEDYLLRQTKARIEETERPIQRRDAVNQMRSPENSLAYDRWLEKKKQHSRSWRYWNPTPSFDDVLQLRIQFDKETNYAYHPRGELKPTDEEQVVLNRMYAERDATQRRLDGLLEKYGIDSVILPTLQFQYTTTDRYGANRQETDPLSVGEE